MKSITKIVSAAVMAGTVFIGQSAVAGPVRYDCTFHNSERSRGWIPAQLFVTVDEDAGRVTAQAYSFLDTSYEDVEGRLQTNSRRITATFQNEDETTSTGRRIYVRYNFRMKRSDLSSSLNVIVNRHGQQERSNGRCVLATKG